MFELTQQLKPQGNPFLPFSHSTHELIHLQNMLQSQAPLVSIEEINELRQLVARASVGEFFLIQSGDCAESFYECDQDTTYEKLEFIDQLAAFFHKKTSHNVLQVGRIAGQYTRSRSNQYEFYQNKKTYAYLSGLTHQFQEKHRIPDPWRMLLVYHCAAAIYREINQWNNELKPEQKIYTSHEVLLLNYEQALTRQDKRTGCYFNRSTHFPWLGQHTIRSMQHINYLKHIANPIAVKIGSDTSIKHLIKVIHALDPDYLPGRITLIPRLGAQHVQRILPQLIEAVNKTQHRVLWSCDPMHGNTEILNSGIRIRKLSHIVDEVKHSFLIHRKMGGKLNAIHLEATHQDVTECMNYESHLCASVSDMKKKYKTLLDPRLNYEQTMHVLQLVARYYAGD